MTPAPCPEMCRVCESPHPGSSRENMVMQRTLKVWRCVVQSAVESVTTSGVVGGAPPTTTGDRHSAQ